MRKLVGGTKAINCFIGAPDQEGCYWLTDTDTGIFSFCPFETFSNLEKSEREKTPTWAARGTDNALTSVSCTRHDKLGNEGVLRLRYFTSPPRGQMPKRLDKKTMTEHT